jgi:hypothetical protein
MKKNFANEVFYATRRRHKKAEPRKVVETEDSAKHSCGTEGSAEATCGQGWVGQGIRSRKS